MTPALPSRPADREASAFSDLDDVVLIADVPTGDGGDMPAGSRGTVVGVYRGGAAYEVEFVEPFHAVVTVRPQQISR